MFRIRAEREPGSKVKSKSKFKARFMNNLSKITLFKYLFYKFDLLMKLNYDS
jgi:hypothetical protein